MEGMEASEAEIENTQEQDFATTVREYRVKKVIITNKTIQT